MEYTIKVTPEGQRVTSNFKALKNTDRDCFNADEIPEKSNMKIYNQQNCKFECRVGYAIEKCACVPWDFPLYSQHYTKKFFNECDVFGRTCFSM